MKKIGAIIGGAVSLIYILNPTSGIAEIIPDIIPYIGNLDEATATGILIWSVRELFTKNKSKEIEEKNKN